jgi:hypothetical protein
MELAYKTNFFCSFFLLSLNSSSEPTNPPHPPSYSERKDRISLKRNCREDGAGCYQWAWDATLPTTSGRKTPGTVMEGLVSLIVPSRQISKFIQVCQDPEDCKAVTAMTHPGNYTLLSLLGRDKELSNLMIGILR